MSLHAVRLAAGPAAHDWLLDRCRSVRGHDPLAPVTILVPGHAVGLQLRRRLAAEAYANVRFQTLRSLAELLGTPALVGEGRSRLTGAAEDAAIHSAAQANHDRFGAASGHPALLEHLRRLFRELREREVPPPERAELSQAGPMAWAALAAYEAYRVDLGAHLYDEQDLLQAAADRADRGTRDVGHLIAFLDGPLLPAEARFVQALAAALPVDVALPELGDAEGDATPAANAAALGLEWEALPAEGAAEDSTLHVTIAPDAPEEVRMAVRRVLADLERGVPLHATAILYRLAEPYGHLVRESLDAAELPWASLDGRPLTETHAGRGLLGLLRLRESSFSRVEVLTWLNTFPRTARDEVSVADWDRISRDAEVVGGVEQWRDRLDRHVRTLQASLRDGQMEQASEGLWDYLDQTAQRAQRMADLVERLERDTRPPAETTWPALAGWAKRLRAAWVRPAGSWSERERGAAALVDGVLDGLAATGSPSAEEVDLGRFLEALEAALQGRWQPEGRVGVGVVVGPIGAARGMAFQRLHVLGASEQAFPTPPPADPLFPSGDGAADPLGRRERRRREERHTFSAALAAAPAVGVSFPSFDVRLRPAYPSRWVVELAGRLEGAPVRASALRELTERPWLTHVRSPYDGLRRGLPALNLAERRAAQLVAAGGTVGDHPLAVRSDLPLGRALEVAASRWSTRFSEFDGNVAAAVPGSRLEGGLAERPTSPTGIEEWAQCPFRHFLGRVLRVAPTERPEQDLTWSVSALVRGRLVHQVLADFYDQRLSLGRPGQHDAQDHERLEALARQQFAELEAGGGTGHRLAWENDQRSILLDLHSLLTRDADLHPDLVPTFLEQPFGFSDADWPAPVVVVDGGREVRLRGRMDRVDLGPDPAQPERAIVIDYKTGTPLASRSLAADPVAAGTSLQPAVYRAALRAHFEALGLPPPAVRARYWFVSARGRFEVIEPPSGLDVDGRLREVVSVADAAFRSGAFPAVPGEDTADWRGRSSWEHCWTCPYTRVCHAARDQLWQRKRRGEAGLLHGRLGVEGG